MEIKWHKLRDLAVKDFNDVHNVSGIYFVRWSKNGESTSIPRLRGVDHQGILYVGSAVKMRRRIRELWKGINGEAEAHTVGKTIIFCKVFEIISPNEYEIAWEELKTREDAIGQESASIGLYAERYKEPPPLNLQLRREMFATVGISKIGRSRLWYEPDEFARSIVTGA
jgi:hypothetical protein